jgi:hypothetical protein
LAQRWIVQYNFYINDQRWGRRRKGMDELETVKIDSRRMGTTESVYNATKAQTAHPFFLRIFASLLLCVRSFSVILGAGAFA